VSVCAHAHLVCVWVCVCAWGGECRLWDLKTGKLIEKFDGHKDSVYSVSFSPDAKLLASGSLDKTLKLWDLSSAGLGNPTGTKCRHTFQGHKDFVLSVVFAPQGTWLISGSKVCVCVCVWERERERESACLAHL